MNASIQSFRKTYDDFNKTVVNVNKQIRNYNIKTTIKITLIATLFFTSSMLMLLATFSLLGLSFPLITYSWKIIAASLVSMPAIGLFVKIFTNIAKRKLSENRNKFLAKIKTDLKKIKCNHTFLILKTLFHKIVGCKEGDHEERINFRLLKRSLYSVKKIKFGSYDKALQRNIKYLKQSNHDSEEKTISMKVQTACLKSANYGVNKYLELVLTCLIVDCVALSLLHTMNIAARNFF